MSEQKQWVSAKDFLQEAVNKIGLHNQDQQFIVSRDYYEPGYGNRTERLFYHVLATQQIEDMRIIYMSDGDIFIATLPLAPTTTLTHELLTKAFKSGGLSYEWYSNNLSKDDRVIQDIYSRTPLEVAKIAQHGVLKSRFIDLHALAMSIAQTRNPFDYSDVTYDLSRADEIGQMVKSWVQERFAILRKRNDLLQQAAELR